MNSVIRTILNRKSTRAYEKRPLEADIKAQILRATLRAPTAGNMMLYSIIEVDDQNKKNSLARTCDNQPFIAKAPLVLLFLADCQRWYDYFIHCGVEEICHKKNTMMGKPQEGDLMIACCDSLIAARTAVIAAESRNRFLLYRGYYGKIGDKQGIVQPAALYVPDLFALFRLSD